MKIIYLLWTPASGPLRGTAGQGNFFILLSLIRRGGVPSGAAVVIVRGGGNYLLIIAEMEDFHRKFSNSRGEHITCNMAITRDPTTGTISVDNPVEDITWYL